MKNPSLIQSNRLRNVTDAVASLDTGGFVDGKKCPTVQDYRYDENGNMTKDRNKGITEITYNHLNLPVKITFESGDYIEYAYNAVGEKVSKTVRAGDTQKIVDYRDGFQYAGGVLQFFPHAGGYVNVTPLETASGSMSYIYDYVYNYTDHLGNIRLSYTKNPKSGELNIIEENHYYPFGLKHEVYSSATLKGFVADEEIEGRTKLVTLREDEFKYKYNGKEWQDELGLNWYDYGARGYMPDIGRWGVTDNKAELYFATSPYVYALNQPTNAIDPDGNVVIFINGNHYFGEGATGYKRPGDSDYGIYGKPRDYNFYGTSDYWGSFDKGVQTQLNDNARAVYRDGSMGGWAPFRTSYLKASSRDKAGFEQGKIDAKTIIKNLERDPQGNIVESIKIITHSMGGAYGKGYVRALKEYISSLPYEMQKQIKITLVADFDPFQGGRLTADSDIFTQQFTHIGGLADQRQKGLDDDNYYEDDEEKSHAIMSFLSDISNLEEGVYEWNNQTKKMECVTCKKDK